MRMIWLATLIISLGILSGCGGTVKVQKAPPFTRAVDANPVAPPTTENVRNLQQAIDDLRLWMKGMDDGLKALANHVAAGGQVGVADVEAFAAKLREIPAQKFADTKKALDVSVTADTARETEKETTIKNLTEVVIPELEKRIEKLERKDPVRTGFRITGYGLVTLGSIALACSIFIVALAGIPWLKGGAAAAICSGLMILAIAEFIVPIRWVIIGGLAAMAVGVIIWVVLNRKAIRDRLALGQAVALSPIPGAPLPSVGLAKRMEKVAQEEVYVASVGARVAGIQAGRNQ